MKRVVIDTDPALGCPGRDVDDGLALFLALNSPELEVEAITITYGNVSLKSAQRSAHRITSFLKKEKIQIYPGASSPRALGKTSEAAERLIHLFSQNPEDVSLLAVGPLTNIATVEKMEPGILRRLREVVIMGGAVYRRGIVPPFFKAEFNFWRDPSAAEIVLRSGANIFLFPLDVTYKVVFGKIEMEQLHSSKTAAGEYLWKNLVLWYWMNKVFTLSDGFHPHDPVVAAYLIKPEMFSLKKLRLDVHTGGIGRGSIAVTTEGAPIKVALDIDKTQFLNLLLNRLLGER
ncbi:MAG: nucleoside hydrolase [bacterium]